MPEQDPTVAMQWERVGLTRGVRRDGGHWRDVSFSRLKRGCLHIFSVNNKCFTNVNHHHGCYWSTYLVWKYIK